MKSGLLTAMELEELTTYKRGEEQAAALRSMGLNPYIGRDGRPKVTWEAITEAMCGRLGGGNKPAGNGPNWSALHASG